MDIKPTLFIGSSGRGLPVAELVKKHLSDFADCKIWNEDVFDYGKATFETLMELLSFFEYGVMVGTADDYTESSKGTKDMETRDNVLFELGLFYGRLGREKVFFMKERGAKTPSDLHGITLPDFTALDAPDLETQIQQGCERIKKQILDRSGRIFDGGIFPSVPLAYGYFFNSILPICRQLTHSPLVKVDGVEQDLQTFSIQVLIPDDLRNDMKGKVEAVKARDKWRQVEVPTSATRSFNFYVQKLDLSHLVIMDIPTTLNALHQTIQEFAGSGKIGRSLKEELVEKREIRQFKKVVDYLANVDSFTKGKVFTEIVDI